MLHRRISFPNRLELGENEAAMRDISENNSKIIYPNFTTIIFVFHSRSSRPLENVCMFFQSFYRACVAAAFMRNVCESTEPFGVITLEVFFALFFHSKHLIRQNLYMKMILVPFNARERRHIVIIIVVESAQCSRNLKMLRFSPAPFLPKVE